MVFHDMYIATDPPATSFTIWVYGPQSRFGYKDSIPRREKLILTSDSAPHLITPGIMAVSPFFAICTPMHNSTNAITRRMPCAVWGLIFAVILGA